MTWIHELAKHLVADESARDDLVQETCMRALERPPRDAGRIRHWLASVMRNLVRQNARGDGWRELREERSAAREAMEPTAGLVERVAVQRELVDTVLEIDEPYRSSLLMRYFEERPPRYGSSDNKRNVFGELSSFLGKVRRRHVFVGYSEEAQRSQGRREPAKHCAYYRTGP